MPSEKWEIRFYQPGDEQQIIPLYQLAFEEPMTEPLWKWKYTKYPIESTKIYTVAVDQGKIVGQYGSIFFVVKYFDSFVLTGQPVDTIVHPDYRTALGKKNLGIDLFEPQEFLAEKYNTPFGFGFPNLKHYRIGKKIYGYKDIGEIPLLRRRTNWRYLAANKTKNLVILKLIWFISAYLYSLKFLFLSVKIHSPIKIRVIDKIDERFNILFKKAAKRYNIINMRDDKALQWRYLEKPNNSYKLVIAEKDSELLGYIITLVKEILTDGYLLRIGYIIDILALPEHNTEEALVFWALRDFIKGKVDFVECWMLEHTDLYPVLKKLGFRRKEPSPKMVYFKFSDKVQEKEIANLKNWYVTLGDSDGV